jgi:hypothetical protein
MIRITPDQIQNQQIVLDSSTIPFGCIPFIVEGYASQWKAFSQWTNENLKSEYGSYPVKCFYVDKTDGTFLQQVNPHKTLLFEKFLSLVFSDNPQDAHQYYLRIDTQQPLFAQLEKDFVIPDWLDDYNHSATGIWIGQKGNVTPFHHDWWHGFLAQVSGKKRYRLVHPLEGATLQRQWDPESQFDLASAPVFSSPELDSLHLETYCEGILEPGEVLYIPPYWYHQIDTLENGNISMPIRYDSTMTPHVPLLQFSQNSILRAVTNQHLTDEDQLIQWLGSNRRLFEEKENAFIKAFIHVRNPHCSLESIREKLEFTTSGLPKT